MLLSNKKKIVIFGPLSVHIKIFSHNPLNLNDEFVYSKKSSLSYGGASLMILRNLKSLGYDPFLCTYVGSDEEGCIIQEKIKDENLNQYISIQKIPNQKTAISLQIYNKSFFSYITSEITDLELFMLRINKVELEKNSVIFIDPGVPSKYQIEIIKKFSKHKIILKKPIDDNLEVLKTSSNLYLLVNEYEAMQLILLYNKCEYTLENFFKLKDLHKHNIILETKFDLKFLEKKFHRIKTFNIEKFNKISFLNLHFISGMMAGLANNQDFELAALWGAANTINAHEEMHSQTDLIQKVKGLSWNIQNL